MSCSSHPRVQRPHDKTPFHRTSSLVVFQRTPLHRFVAICVLSRSSSLTRVRPSASDCQVKCVFHPCRSSQLRWFAPQMALQVCFTLLPAMGSEPFPTQSPSCCIAATVGPLGFPRARISYPSKRSPPRQPHCVTTAVSFPPLLAITVSSAAHPTTRPCSIAKSVPRRRCCHPRRARCFLGLGSPSRFSPHA